MKANRIDEYHKNNFHVYGRLVVVDYLTDAQQDKNWGKQGAEVTIDYLQKARALVAERYHDYTELQAVPELVVRLT